MLFSMFYFILCTVLIFQGLHLASEVKSPLGTLPEEVGQAPRPSYAWGSYLMGFGVLAALLGLLGFAWPLFVPMRKVLFTLGLVSLALFGLWVIFLGRKAEFMGVPAVSDDHGHH